MKRVALFFDRTYIEAHFCFKELAVQLARAGYRVDLYFNHTPDPPRFDAKLPIRLIPFGKSPLGTIRVLAILVRRYRSYEACVATPQWTLYWAWRLRPSRRVKLICLSDEVYADKVAEFSEAQKRIGPAQAKWKGRERRAHQHCDATIALGAARYELVRQINQLSREHRHFIIPNAPAASAQAPRLDVTAHYRQHFGLRETDTVLLHSGSLLWSFVAQLEQLTFQDLDLRLVLQVRGGYAKKFDFRSPAILLSERRFRYEEMVALTRGADIGLLLYDETHPEERRNGNTAGKLGLYLAAGLPIIGCNLKVFEWLEAEGCGLRIEDLSALEGAVATIRQDYDRYAQASRRVFQEQYEYLCQVTPFLNWLVG